MASNHNGFIVHYNQFKDKIYNYFWYRIGFDQKTAEDLTSEVFLKALKKIADFDDTRPFGPWIFAIAHNHLINYYKMNHRELPLEDQIHLVSPNNQDIEEKLEIERVIAQINTLEAGDREILLLKFVDDLTNTEIATLLDKKEGAVRTHLSRSLAKLRGLLSK